MRKAILAALGISFIALVGCASEVSSPGEESSSTDTDPAALKVEAQLQARAEKKAADLESSLPKDEHGNYYYPADWRETPEIPSPNLDEPPTTEMRDMCAGGFGSLLVCCYSLTEPCCVYLNSPCGGQAAHCGGC